jgi:uncharacterized membrane protein YeiH
MVSSDAGLQVLLDVVGVFVVALSGALVAVRVHLDLFGVLTLAWVAGLGGGIVRDVLLTVSPPVGISDLRLMATAVLAGCLVFALHDSLVRLAHTHPRLALSHVPRLIRVLDAGGLAVFAVSGGLKALGLGAGATAAVVVGVVTAVGGGLLRDLLAGQVPEVLRRELYAIPALIGSGLLVWASRADLLGPAVIWGCVVLIFVVRMTAVVLDLNAPGR